MNPIKNLMQADIFTSSEFNRTLNDSIEHGWNSKVTLDFLYVAESLGMVKCLGFAGSNNQYHWKVIE